jgi:hypothetical protein
VQGNDTRRYRKITIVAMARKLLIALWRYVTNGVLPEGAALKAGARQRRWDGSVNQDGTSTDAGLVT